MINTKQFYKSICEQLNLKYFSHQFSFLKPRVQRSILCLIFFKGSLIKGLKIALTSLSRCTLTALINCILENIKKLRFKAEIAHATALTTLNGFPLVVVHRRPCREFEFFLKIETAP